jgi:tetratricopeptide (TPR) repeat protein
LTAKIAGSRLDGGGEMINKTFSAFLVLAISMIALRGFAQSADDYIRKGKTYSDQGQHEKAIIEYKKAVEINPKYALAYYNLGCAYRELGETDKGIDNLTTAIKCYEKYPQAYYSRGLSYYDIGKYEAAINDFSKAIEYDSNFYVAYCFRAVVYTKIGDTTKAISDYTKAIEISPKTAHAYFFRSLAYVELKDYDNALKDLEKVDEISPRNYESKFSQAKIFLLQGLEGKAERRYKDAYNLTTLILNSEQSAGHYLDAAWYGLFVPCFKDVERNSLEGLAKYPTFIGLHSNLGHAYLLQGKKEEALREYKTFIENYKPNPKEVLKEDLSLLKLRYPQKVAIIDEIQQTLGLLEK